MVWTHLASRSLFLCFDARFCDRNHVRNPRYWSFLVRTVLNKKKKEDLAAGCGTWSGSKIDLVSVLRSSDVSALQKFVQEPVTQNVYSVKINFWIQLSLRGSGGKFSLNSFAFMWSGPVDGIKKPRPCIPEWRGVSRHKVVPGGDSRSAPGRIPCTAALFTLGGGQGEEPAKQLKLAGETRWRSRLSQKHANPDLLGQNAFLELRGVGAFSSTTQELLPLIFQENTIIHFFHKSKPCTSL